VVDRVGRRHIEDSIGQLLAVSDRRRQLDGAALASAGGAGGEKER
jgi:hypothetical protein